MVDNENNNNNNTQHIIDRKPFGEEPPEAETIQIPISESFAKDLRLSVMYEGSEGDVRVGVINNALKKTYTLKFGEIVINIT